MDDTVPAFFLGVVATFIISFSFHPKYITLKACKDTKCTDVAIVTGRGEECAKFALAVNMPGYTLVCD